MIDRTKEFIVLHGEVFYIRGSSNFSMQKSMISKEPEEMKKFISYDQFLQPCDIEFQPEDSSLFSKLLSLREETTLHVKCNIGTYLPGRGCFLLQSPVKVIISQLEDQPDLIRLSCFSALELYRSNNKIIGENKLSTLLDINLINEQYEENSNNQ